ncbi:pyrimidine 5'-nucleotidase [Photobacterium sp. WH77]|uniref:pyrimidine 5'-nucleotidase n=1 Tax=Photobacterium TaxID=657 RepID=UPI001EDB9031|nr:MULTISPECIES: pyrimidine 5'-nucleotidase [Photobacterium]MCG2837241.1 pyrimidine 5'-nucleotidase [Photobacterium sp. WH77]MCG2844857.1 pyrimidine 5'-nucleotidase [Photobacterium sp. WH80]MDO6581451.1 pyrimidine 5'-nucleotidase [Photobacterium sp. 2_MG-2023]
MKYQWILFDADETLFHFDAYRGLKLMFSRFEVDFTPEHFSEYQRVNQPLWVDYQNGDIDAEQLKHQRFESWAQQLGVTTVTLNSAFLEAMADTCSLLPGAATLLERLNPHVKMGIITNGFTELQDIRLQRTGVDHYFSSLIISEKVGAAKPSPIIFDYAINAIGNPAPSTVLMVGDNPHSDILGGMKAGMDTCWLNHHDAQAPEGIRPSYTVRHLDELTSLLFN